MVWLGSHSLLSDSLNFNCKNMALDPLSYWDFEKQVPGQKICKAHGALLSWDTTVKNKQLEKVLFRDGQFTQSLAHDETSGHDVKPPHQISKIKGTSRRVKSVVSMLHGFARYLRMLYFNKHWTSLFHNKKRDDIHLWKPLCFVLEKLSFLHKLSI